MISVVILTKDEEERIGVCLGSVKSLADEIIVVDSESKDKTAEIAKKEGAKVYTRAFDNYVNQKNYAFAKTSGDWVLYIDADERVLEPLKEEIKSLVVSADASAYALSRRNIILGQEVKYGQFWPDWIIRLVKRKDFQGWKGEVHETLCFKGKLSYTKNSLLHLTHRNIDQIILKSLNWSKIDAKLRLDSQHPKMSSWRFLRILLTELFQQGIIKKGFFAGPVGTIDALMQTFSLVMTYARLWQMQQNPQLPEVYQRIDQKLIDQHFNY